MQSHFSQTRWYISKVKIVLGRKTQILGEFCRFLYMVWSFEFPCVINIPAELEIPYIIIFLEFFSVDLIAPQTYLQGNWLPCAQQTITITTTLVVDSSHLSGSFNPPPGHLLVLAKSLSLGSVDPTWNPSKRLSHFCLSPLISKCLICLPGLFS